MPALDPNQVAAAEKLKGAPLTAGEKFAHEHGRRDRPESVDVNMQRANFKPVPKEPAPNFLVRTMQGENGAEIMRDETIAALEREKIQTDKLAEDERVKRMSPAERRAYQMDIDLAKYRKEKEAEKESKAWARKHKDKLDVLQSLYDQLKWREDVSAEDLWLIERAQLQIRAGKDASQAAADKYFTEAIGVPARLAQAADAEAKRQIAELQKQVEERAAQIRALNPNAKVPEVVVEQQPVADDALTEAKKSLVMAEAQRLLGQSDIFKAAGLREEAHDLLMQSVDAYLAARAIGRE